MIFWIGEKPSQSVVREFSKAEEKAKNVLLSSISDEIEEMLSQENVVELIQCSAGTVQVNTALKYTT